MGFASLVGEPPTAPAPQIFSKIAQKTALGGCLDGGLLLIYGAIV